jgi:hypothetical protein
MDFFGACANRPSAEAVEIEVGGEVVDLGLLLSAHEARGLAPRRAADAGRSTLKRVVQRVDLSNRTDRGRATANQPGKKRAT